MSERKMKRQYKPVPDYRRDDPDADTFKLLLATEQRAREALVAMEEIKLLQERLAECYRRDPVNHYTKCEDIAREYVRRISRPGFKDGPVEMSEIP